MSSSSRRRAPPLLRVAVPLPPGSDEARTQANGGGGGDGPSFLADAHHFTKQNVDVTATGVTLTNRLSGTISASVNPDELCVGEVLGRGVSSCVRAAVHVPTGTPLALKVISIFEKAKRDQLIREIQTLFSTRCETLVAFYGAFHREGQIFVALELMDRGDLASVCARRGPLPEGVLAGVAFQIMWALAYLRRERRLMRDIKPGNVLCASDGRVVLSDFGISAELCNSIGMAASFVGTCKYMAPERITHQPYSFPSDVWSAGLALLEAATGVYPYPASSGTSYIELAETIIDSPEPACAPPLSPDCATFIGSCLKKAPGERLPADVLLGSPFLARHGVVSLESARTACRAWFAASASPTASTAAAATASTSSLAPSSNSSSSSSSSSSSFSSSSSSSAAMSATASRGLPRDSALRQSLTALLPAAAHALARLDREHDDDDLVRGSSRSGSFTSGSFTTVGGGGGGGQSVSPHCRGSAMSRTAEDFDLI